MINETNEEGSVQPLPKMISLDGVLIEQSQLNDKISLLEKGSIIKFQKIDESGLPIYKTLTVLYD